MLADRTYVIRLRQFD